MRAAVGQRRNEGELLAGHGMQPVAVPSSGEEGDQHGLKGVAGVRLAQPSDQDTGPRTDQAAALGEAAPGHGRLWGGLAAAAEEPQAPPQPVPGRAIYLYS